MTVLVVHNRYRETGGEDRVVDLETALLERYGHRVVRYMADNHQIDSLSRPGLAGRAFWNHDAFRTVRALIARERVDLMHVHNTLPLISPSVYYAAYAERVPVVQTLHNYRLLCPSASCVRDGAACTACVTEPIPWRAVRYACYRSSRAATATVAGTVLLHRVLGTWKRRVDVYIAPTEFARRMFIAGGLPPDRIAVKPHFVDPDPGVGSGAGGYALYAGRLSAEKGVQVLLDAWTHLASRMPLTIVGDGPLAPAVAEAARRVPGITWIGPQAHEQVQRLMGAASLLIAPSIAFGTFGQVIAEAYAAGTPVVATGGGAATELVHHRRTGLLVPRGDVADLISQIEWLLARPAVMQAMRGAARAAYEARFTGDANYGAVMAVYDEARARAAACRRGRLAYAA